MGGTEPQVWYLGIESWKAQYRDKKLSSSYQMSYKPSYIIIMYQELKIIPRKKRLKKLASNFFLDKRGKRGAPKICGPLC